MVATPATSSFVVKPTTPSASNDPIGPTVLSIPSLLTFLSAVPDPRRAQGRRHSLPAVLSLVCAALLCGVRGYQAVAQWGRDYPSDLTRALGFPGATPCGSTLHEVLGRLDWDRFAAEIHTWAEAVLSTLLPAGAALPDRALALDGKTLRGSRTQEAEITHLVSVVSHRLGITLAQAGVATAGAEPSVVQEVLRAVLLEGRVVTVDALHTQEEVAETILAGGGDYMMTVKRNQPILRETIQAVFAPHLAAEQDRQVVQTEDRGHGRIERRRLTAVSVSPDDMAWPGAAQVFIVERQVTHPRRPLAKRHTRAVVYGITSLARAEADAPTLLSLNRGHWTIENRSHWVRDVVFGEDLSQVASGKIARVMAGLRCTALNLLRREGVPNVAAATRRLAAQPGEILRLLKAGG